MVLIKFNPMQRSDLILRLSYRSRPNSRRGVRFHKPRDDPGYGADKTPDGEKTDHETAQPPHEQPQDIMLKRVRFECQTDGRPDGVQACCNRAAKDTEPAYAFLKSIGHHDFLQAGVL